MTSLVIRPLQTSDETEWRRLWTEYLEYYESTVPEKVYQSSFARLLGDDPHDFNGFIAEYGGKPIGLVHFLYHRHGWKIENVCYLQDLYVSPEIRNTGAGRALIEAVYARSEEDGVATVYWLTQDFNEPARKLYDKVAALTPFIKYQHP